MKTIEKETLINFEEKKSKFFGYIKPIRTVAEAEAYIEYVKKMHPNATHNCSAYRLVENGQEYYKVDDDGEPSGTAGKPIGEIFITLGVYNLVVIVTRYFGGIKLGAGGLIRNYAKTAKLAVNEAQIIEYISKKEFLIDFNYNKSSDVERIIADEAIEIYEKTFDERISYKLLLSEEQKQKFEEMKDVLIIGV